MPADSCQNPRRMDEADKDLPKPKYKWPWFVLAAVLMAILLAFIWMFFAVEKVKQERGFSAPAPAAQ
ncbi:MAG: hypothetical protein ACLQSR_11420 [Limisphaerales bacterium]